MRQTWSSAPAVPRLRDDEIHIWRASLRRDPGEIARLATSLNDDERARAARFVFDRDRNDFTAARGILRDLVGQYTGRPAASIGFTYEAEGKPRLQRVEGDPPLSFNLSHANGFAVYAFARGRTVGVDVESTVRKVSVDDIAARFFSPSEQRAISVCSDAERTEAFFRGWTRKEAYIKARGGGLSIPLDSFDVSISTDPAVRLTSADSDRWTIHAFAPEQDYVAAIAVEGNASGLLFWDWQPQRRG